MLYGRLKNAMLLYEKDKMMLIISSSRRKQRLPCPSLVISQPLASISSTSRLHYKHLTSSISAGLLHRCSKQSSLPLFRTCTTWNSPCQTIKWRLLTSTTLLPLSTRTTPRLQAEASELRPWLEQSGLAPHAVGGLGCIGLESYRAMNAALSELSQVKLMMIFHDIIV